MAGAHRSDSTSALVSDLKRNIEEQLQRTLQLERDADWNVRQIDILESYSPDLANVRHIFGALVREDLTMLIQKYGRAIEALDTYLENL